MDCCNETQEQYSTRQCHQRIPMRERADIKPMSEVDAEQYARRGSTLAEFAVKGMPKTVGEQRTDYRPEGPYTE